MICALTSGSAAHFAAQIRIICRHTKDQTAGVHGARLGAADGVPLATILNSPNAFARQFAITTNAIAGYEPRSRLLSLASVRPCTSSEFTNKSLT